MSQRKVLCQIHNQSLGLFRDSNCSITGFSRSLIGDLEFPYPSFYPGISRDVKYMAALKQEEWRWYSTRRLVVLAYALREPHSFDRTSARSKMFLSLSS